MKCHLKRMPMYRDNAIPWLYMPIAVMLYPLVVANYRQRVCGEAPDEWYWADRVLENLGWYVAVSG